MGKLINLMVGKDRSLQGPPATKKVVGITWNVHYMLKIFSEAFHLLQFFCERQSQFPNFLNFYKAKQVQKGKREI